LHRFEVIANYWSIFAFDRGNARSGWSP